MPIGKAGNAARTAESSLVVSRAGVAACNANQGRARPARRCAGGFTYIGLLAAIAIIGIGISAVGQVSHSLQMREKERELLFVGDQFRKAIASYKSVPPGIYPQSLDDLLLDKRFPNVRRHLRRIYVDPMTGSKQWGLVDIPGRGIAGVFSLSDETPLKTQNFPVLYKAFEGKTKYSEWRFFF